MSDKATSGAKAEFGESRGYAYYVFTLLFLLYVFDYVDRMVISALILSDPQKGKQHGE